MSRRPTHLLAFVLTITLTLVACSDDPESNNGALTNNGNNGNNGAADTGPDTTGDADQPELSVLSIQPVEGAARGGEPVTISGTGFVDGATVFFGDHEAEPTTFVSQYELEATTPTSPPGVVDVIVENPDGTTSTLSDGFEFIPESYALLIGWCNLQHPAATTTQVDQETEGIFGRVFVEQCSEGASHCQEVAAEIGWGDLTVDPSTSPDDWTWQSASYNADHTDDDNDEYQATIVPDTEGDFAYAFRFAIEGGPWTYCDLDGTGDDNDFSSEHMGELTVEAEPTPDPVAIDWCNIQHPESTTTTVGAETEVIYGQVYSDGCTGENTHCDGITAELGVGPADGDPTTDSDAYEWAEASYNAGHTGTNNDEYQATLTPADAGDYTYVYRFSGDDGATWTYCDLADANDGFDAAQQGTLTVDP